MIEKYPDAVWCLDSCQDAWEDLVCGNRAQDATTSHTHSEDAQDAQDANLTSLASGCKAGAPDAPYIFADAIDTLPSTMAFSSGVLKCISPPMSGSAPASRSNWISLRFPVPVDTCTKELS